MIRLNPSSELEDQLDRQEIYNRKEKNVNIFGIPKYIRSECNDLTSK